MRHHVHKGTMYACVGTVGCHEIIFYFFKRGHFVHFMGKLGPDFEPSILHVNSNKQQN